MLLAPSLLHADARAVYTDAVTMAASGETAAAIVSLNTASQLLTGQSVWKERIEAARILLEMQKAQQLNIAAQTSNPYLALANRQISSREKPVAESWWPVAVLATLIPGAGHGWQGRWSDAATVTLMVVPMLILTLWAARRRMGPVTVFFALITVWFWSGTVYSAISLAERSSFESYMLWWQSVWQASGLPGQAW